MGKDVQCPYCEEWQDINHDDGYGYDQDRLHQQECEDCGKTFGYSTAISFDYEAYKADCLNGFDHVYEPIATAPVECTEMRCRTCGEHRQPTSGEWEDIMSEYHNVRNRISKDYSRKSTQSTPRP